MAKNRSQRIFKTRQKMQAVRSCQISIRDNMMIELNHYIIKIKGLLLERSQA